MALGGAGDLRRSQLQIDQWRGKGLQQFEESLCMQRCRGLAEKSHPRGGRSAGVKCFGKLLAWKLKRERYEGIVSWRYR